MSESASEKESVERHSPASSIDTVSIVFKNRPVQARKLTVHSELAMDIDLAWNNVKTPALLQFVSRGMIRFKPVDGGLPRYWEKGHTYAVNMHFFGFLPLGGRHFLYVENIDDSNYEIATREWDGLVNVWNHAIVLRKGDTGKIYYEDSIVIYAGILTGFVTQFARIFYKYRQRRWQIVAKERLAFGT